MPKQFFDLQTKLNLIDAIDNYNGKVNYTVVGKKFGIDRRTVARIYKRKDVFKLQSVKGYQTQKRKKINEERINEALFIWYRSQSADTKINHPILKQKALECAVDLGIDFEPSDNWISRFIVRHDIAFKKKCGDKKWYNEGTSSHAHGGLSHLFHKDEAMNIEYIDEADLYDNADQNDDSSQDTAENLKIKEEPADTGYEKASANSTHSENDSQSNSRSSSPCPPVHFGSMSPAQGRDSPSQGAGSSQSGHQTPLNDIYVGSSIRTHLQGASTGKKSDTVQNIVEGLLKKNATLLAMSDTGGLRPQRRQKNQESKNSKKFDQKLPATTFPISTKSQVRLVQSKARKSETNKPMLLRPKSPTKKCGSILKDKSQFSYSLMESAVGDETIEKIFKVQHHELICAISSKPYIFDKFNHEKTMVASLENNYYWCNFCSFSSSNKSVLTNHIMDHRFSCKFCPYESFCRSDIMRHMSKLHEEFQEISNNMSYCTFLADYIRIKARTEGKENDTPVVDQDEDVGELDKDTMKSYQADNLKRKLEHEDSQDSASGEKWSKVDSPEDVITNGARSDRQGKSRKSQNPRRHPQVNEKDYDTFEMEVEEIDESENGNNNPSDRVLYPSSSDNSSDHKNPSNAVGSHMQLIPSLQDEEDQSFTATHVTRPLPARAGNTPTFASNNRTNKGTHRGASASSLYWSCGYCDFQSSSQAEIKEHSNRTHPGKPHRYVALIKNMTPESIINKNANKSNENNYNSSSSIRGHSPSTKSSLFSSVKLDNVAHDFDKDGSSFDEVVSLKNKTDDNLLKVKFASARGPKKEMATYKCYHCIYTAKRHSSMKSHIYYKHRGKGLLAVDEDANSGEQVFFCARDDCSFKSVVPTAYLAHVEQCTPWHKPELADVEVEPHIRECLQQTVTFAEMALDKVDMRNTVNSPAVLDKHTSFSDPSMNDKTTPEAAEELPSSPSTNDVNSLKLDKYAKDHTAEYMTEKCVTCESDEGPHDIYYAEEKEYSDSDNNDSFAKSDNDKESIKEEETSHKNLSSCDNSRSSFVEEDSFNSEIIEEEEENSALSDNEINCEEDKELCASSLKLTFRTVGDKTVCSMMQEDENQSCLESESNTSGLEQNDKSDGESDSEVYSKWIEEELIDSTSDSDENDSLIIQEKKERYDNKSVSDNDKSSSRDDVKQSDDIATKKDLNHVSADVCANYTCPIVTQSASPVEEKSGDQFLFVCVPARSAAMKAMTKMKPVIDDEVDETEDDEALCSGGKKTQIRSKHVDDSLCNNITSKEKSSSIPSSSRGAVYTCKHCDSFGAGPLRKVKSHIVNQHPSVLPVVVNLKLKTLKKKNTFFVCPFSSCNKLFRSFDALTSHRTSHSSLTVPRLKERLGVHSYSSNDNIPPSSLSLLFPTIHVPLEAENIPECHVLLRPLDQSQLDALHNIDHDEIKSSERYECLYCTEHFSHNTLLGLKHHYAVEHPTQLLVLRDMEAKKGKLVSRIYACEESECEFTSISRSELDSHAKCHKSNCTFVYECAVCGWFSSSFWTAKDHLKNEHATEDNDCLIHMQLSVDENGHTSKKVLRSL